MQGKEFKTKEQAEELKKICDHIGAHGPVAQNVVVNPTEMLVITSHNCMFCGHIFTNINPVPMPSGARFDKVPPIMADKLRRGFKK
jgi:hypothetical protein